MAAVAAIQITVDGQGAVSAINNVKSEVQAMGPAFTAVGMQSNVVLTKMAQDHDRARDSARLLREETGIFLPRALQGLIAQSQILGPILNSAFSVFAIVGFIEVLSSIPKHISNVVEHFTHWNEQAQKMNDLQKGWNEIWSVSAQKFADFNDQLQLVGLKGTDLMTARLQQMKTKLIETNDSAATLKNEITQLSHVIDQGTTRTPASDVLFGADPYTQTKAAKEAELQRTEKSKQYDQLTNSARDLEEQMALIAKGEDKAFGEEANKRLEEHRQLMEKTIGMVSDQMSTIGQERGRPGGAPADILGLPSPEEGQRQVDIQDALTDSLNRYMAAAKAGVMFDKMFAKEDAEVAKQAQETAREWTQARDQMANSIDTFFNDVTSGNLGKSFLRQFEKMVSQMVATWIMGLRGMTQSTSSTLFGSVPGAPMGTSGGILGSIMNLGGGGAVAAGGAIDGSFLNNLTGLGGSGGFTGADASMLGMPLSAGGGASSPWSETLPAGASTAGIGGIAQQAGGFGGLLGLFKGAGIMNLLTMGGILGGMQLLGSRNTAVKTIGGFLTGGFGGLAAGGLLASLGIISPLVAFAGPIGAIAGALFGLFSALSGHGKQKIQQTQVLQDMQHQLDLLQRAYDVHQIDYNSAIGQAEQMRTNYIQQQEQIQKGGGPSRVNPWIDAFERHIYQEEQQRQNSLAAAAKYGPPQFHTGGFVEYGMSFRSPALPGARPYHIGGVVNANLFEGEFVMRPEAVQRIGKGNLAAMNAGRDAGITVNMHFPSVYDSKGFEETLHNNLPALNRVLARAVAEGRL